MRLLIMHKYKQTASSSWKQKQQNGEAAEREVWRGGAAAQPAHQGGHSAPEDMKCKGDSKRLQVP